MTKWEVRIRKNCRQLKTEDINDYNTDYVDIDWLLSSYLEEFKNHRRNNLKKIQKVFSGISKDTTIENEINFDSVQKVVLECRKEPENQSNLLGWTGPVTTARALLYAFMTGANTS